MDKELPQEEHFEKLADKESSKKRGVEIYPEQENSSEKANLSLEPEEEIIKGGKFSEKHQKSSQTVSKPHEEELSPVLEKEIEEVEDILEDDLEEIYTELDPSTQKTFKEQGEETAKQIVVTIHKVKHHTRKIFKLVARWLRIIPGVNKLFVEQEAKIKTDKIEEEISHHHEQK